jgi:uncharacterized protein
VIASPIACLIAIAFAAAAGCVSAPARFYTLDCRASPGAAPVAGATVMVGPVKIPASVDQPQFVVQIAPNRVEVNEFNRWVAPLDDTIAHAVAGNVSVLLGTSDVAAMPFANFNPDYWVTIDVQRFESVRGQSALVEAVWIVRRTASGETRSGRTVARETAQGDSFDALAAAHSRALATLSGDIAAAIRAEAARNRSGRKGESTHAIADH